MTCIVGLVTEQELLIGGDCAGTDGLNVRLRRDPKVFIKDEFLYGFTSSFRMGQLLRHSFTAPKITEDCPLDDYMAGPWIGAVRNCLTAGGYSTISNNVEMGGTFLVGYRGELFLVESDFQVAQMQEPFDACGGGAPYALGVLKTLHRSATAPRQIVQQALDVAAHFSAGVRAPFTILTLPRTNGYYA